MGPPRPKKLRDRRRSAESNGEQLQEGSVPRWSAAPEWGRLRRPGAREGARRGVGGDTWKAKLPQGSSGAGQRTGNGRCVGVASRRAAYISCSRAVRGELGRQQLSGLSAPSAAGVRGGSCRRRSAPGSRALSEAAREVILGAVGWAGYVVSGGGGLRCLRLF